MSGAVDLILNGTESVCVCVLTSCDLMQVGGEGDNDVSWTKIIMDEAVLVIVGSGNVWSRALGISTFRRTTTGNVWSRR